MSETLSSYVATHQLGRKYGLGLAFVALAALGSTLNGDSASLVTFKTMAAVPFAIAFAFMSQIYNPERSKTPFQPSFVERTMLEAVLLAMAITLVSWTPETHALRIIVMVVVTAAVYFAIKSGLYVVMRRK